MTTNDQTPEHPFTPDEPAAPADLSATAAASEPLFGAGAASETVEAADSTGGAPSQFPSVELPTTVLPQGGLPGDELPTSVLSQQTVSSDGIAPVSGGDRAQTTPLQGHLPTVPLPSAERPDESLSPSSPSMPQDGLPTTALPESQLPPTQGLPASPLTPGAPMFAQPEGPTASTPGAPWGPGQPSATPADRQEQHWQAGTAGATPTQAAPGWAPPGPSGTGAARDPWATAPAATGPRRPLTGTIIWGSLILAFCGFITQRILAPDTVQPAVWVTAVVLFLGVALVGAGIAAIVRQARHR